MSTYTSKPVTIQAVQIPDASNTTIVEALTEAFGSFEPFYMTENGDVSMVTIQGKSTTASPGEWVIREQADPNRFYPCDPDVFAQRYEEVVR